MIRRILVVVLVVVAGCRNAPAQTDTAAPQGAPPATAAQAEAQAPPSAPKPIPAELPAVVAKVNGEEIPRGELQEAVKAVEGRSGGPLPAERRDSVYRGVLDQLVLFRLLVQESKTRSVAVTDEEVQARIGELRKQFPTEDAFKSALASQGMTPERLPKETRAALLARKVVDAAVPEGQPVTEEAVQKFYQDNLDKHFKEGKTVRASHILVRAASDADEATKKKAKAEAEGLLAQVQGGGDFAELAKTHSGDPGSAARGGDLGFFGKGQMVPPFEAAAFALAPGGLSGVVESPFGYHIIKLVERKPGRTVPLAEVSERIKAHLGQEQREGKVRAFIEQLRSKGKVEILI